MQTRRPSVKTFPLEHLLAVSASNGNIDMTYTARPSPLKKAMNEGAWKNSRADRHPKIHQEEERMNSCVDNVSPTTSDARTNALKQRNVGDYGEKCLKS